jgi:lysophospholipase L1-like esterase
VQNLGVSGARIDVGGNDVNDAQWLHSTAGARRRAFNFIVVNVGINDLRNDYSAANCFTDLQTIYNSVLADPDNRLIACTVTPFKGDTGYTAGREAERIALNDSIRGFVAANANSYLVDLATILCDSADRQQYWPAYDLDHLHPDQAGADAMAAAVADRLLAVGLA